VVAQETELGFKFDYIVFARSPGVLKPGMMVGFAATAGETE